MVEHNFSGVWTPESLRYLKANCQLSAEEMRDLLTERFKIQPALQTVRNEMSKARKEARLESEAMTAAISSGLPRRPIGVAAVSMFRSVSPRIGVSM